MVLFFSGILPELGIVTATLLVAAYFYFTRNFNIWRKKGIPYIKPVPFVGNYLDVTLGRKSMGVVMKDLYFEAKDKPYVGVFGFDQPMLLVRDIEFIKKVLVKDFNVFINRSFRPDKDKDPLSHRGLFGVRGQKWRDLRVKLTPTFTSGKMKRMFYLVDECGKQLVIHIDKHTDGGILEVKDAMARYTTDVISTCAFGIDGDSLTNDKSVFRSVFKNVFEELTYFKGLALVASFLSPDLLSALKLQIVDNEVVKFVRKTVWSTVEYREKNNVVRNDFLDQLMQIRKKGLVDDNGTNGHTKDSSDNFVLDGDDFVAQAFLFLIAGFETSSTTMSFALYELSLHPEIQTQLREEIQSVLQNSDGVVTYEGIQEMSYLDKVVAETLRKYPVLPFLDRKTVVPYTLPNTNIQLDKDAVILISVMGIHYDPDFYPNPEQFDPENFCEERKRARPNYTYLPFGDGPRNCIGDRMGLMQTKVGLVHVLSHYEVRPCEQTPMTVKFNPANSLLAPLGNLPLRFNKLA